MSAAELKSQIINKVETISDPEVLAEIYRLVAFETENAPTYLVDEVEKAALDQGLKDIHEGLRFTNEQANQMVMEWRKK